MQTLQQGPGGKSGDSSQKKEKEQRQQALVPFPFHRGGNIAQTWLDVHGLRGRGLDHGTASWPAQREGLS